MTGIAFPPRARYGLIFPSSNRILEPHVAHYSPPGLSPHVTRLRMTGPYFMPVEQLTPNVTEAAGELADAGCDPIVFHCTANSMAEGLAGEAAIKAAVAAAGVKAITTASATMDALAALGARRIVLASPYPRPAHAHELKFMDEAGIEVVGERNLDLSPASKYPEVTPAEWVAIMEELRNDRADAYFVSCAAVRAMESLEEMEARLGKPVITSNQVVIWRAARMAGFDGELEGLGILGRTAAAALQAA
jgi:maleate isomerase